MPKQMLQAGVIFLLLLASSATIYSLSEIHTLRSQLASILEHPVENGVDDSKPYSEWIEIYDHSTLYDVSGAPSLRFKDLAPDDPEKPRDFEIGFYRYGPTWYTQNAIIEFWIGNDPVNGGTFSISGNDMSGGQIHVRNPFDTDGISIDFRNAERPTISTETGLALHFAANDGLISDDVHRFDEGIMIPQESGTVGQVRDGDWNEGKITVFTGAMSESSLLLITPTSQPQGQWWIESLAAGESFTLASSAPDETMDFNWLIVRGD